MSFSIYDVVDFNLPSLAHPEFSTKLHAIADAFAVHPGHQLPVPSVIADSKELKDYANQFTTVLHDLNRVAERDPLRVRATSAAASTVMWAIVRSNRENDPSLIANIGLDPKKKTTTRSKKHSAVGTPVIVRLVRSPLSGTVIMSISKAEGGITHEIRFGQGDPTLDETYTGMVESALCRGIVISGLEPGKVYHFKVRSFGAAGRGPWSAVVSLMVV